LSPEPPLCHVFRHEQRWFVYDAGSDRLLRVDDCLADVLGAWQRVGTPAAIAGEMAGRRSPAAVARALHEIADARNRGLLLPAAPVLAAPATDETADLYAHGQQHLALTVTEDCNLRCRYCLHGSTNPWIRPHRPRCMPRQTALRAVATFLDHADRTALPIVSFYGGEPLLNLPVIEAVCDLVARHPRGRDVRLVVDTNGTRLVGAAELIRRHGLFLQVSLDGPASVHDRYRVSRGKRPTHRRVEDNLTRLLAEDPSLARRLRIQVTLMPDTDLEAIDAYFADFPPFRRNGLPGSPSLGVTAANLAGVPVAREVLTARNLERRRRSLEEARRRFVAACREGRRRELGPVTRALFEPRLIRWYHRSRGVIPGRLRPTGCCLPGVRKVHVRADGVLQPCERVGQTMSLGTVAGWIEPAAVRGLWERFLEALGDRCRDCWAVRHCDLCFTVLAPHWDRGPAPALPERLCRAVRRRLEDDLRLYASVRGEDGRGTAWLRDTRVA